MVRWRRRLMIWLAIGLAMYASVVLLLYLFQDRLIFVAAGRGQGTVLPSIAGVEVEWRATADGQRFRVAIGTPSESPRGVLVYFVGNGEDLSSGVYHARDMADYGVEAWVAEYPGYGESEGEPSWKSLMAVADVVAAAATARARELDRPLFVVGSSLGTFCAVHVAARAPVHRLLLRAPPTSLAEAGQRQYPWLPVRWLIRHPFDSLALAPQVRCPTLIVHGDRDRIVPAAMGRRLAEEFGGAAEFVEVAGYGHNDLSVSPSGPLGKRVREFFFGQ